MRHAIERALVALILASIVAACLTLTARATIQDDSCLYPDVEYPMPCDDDDDGD